MTPELKALWLAALRSGEYPQTIDTLKAHAPATGYCCLGVLCHVAAEAGMLPSGLTVSEDDTGMLVAIEDEGDRREEVDELPTGAFGLADDVLTQCVMRNDGRGDWLNNRQTFPAIADYLETVLVEAA